MFSGSYLKSDVEFLLKPIDIDFTNIQDKEQSIQSGKKHYSEMISKEYTPSKEYLDIFYRAYELNRDRFAKDILILASNLAKIDNLVLVSLARAGTPIGVLLKRAINSRFDLDIPHYSISIIRDREVDENALNYINKTHSNSNIAFIDGWTGKGVINRELKKFIASYNQKYSTNISDRLYVVSDIAGKSDFSVTYDDYLIPSSALNSTISGLVSRTILNKQYIFENDFHGCKYYKEYISDDLSLWFVDSISKIVNSIELKTQPLLNNDINLQNRVDTFIKKIQNEFNISNINYIKPGIGETTRVLLRRVPYLIIVRDIDDKAIEHLKILAKEKSVKILEDKSLPYSALGIIKDLKDKK
jgi:hypothetical protein